MVDNVPDAIQQAKVQGTIANGAPQAKRIDKKGVGDFETLLGKASREMILLKNKAKLGNEAGSTDSLEKPEELENAIQNATHNFKSAMKVGQNLIDAYRTTLDAIKQKKD